MEVADKDHALLKGDQIMQTIDACEDYIHICGLPTEHIIDDLQYDIISYTESSSISEDEKNQLFAIFEINMRKFYEESWGWDKKMKW